MSPQALFIYNLAVNLGKSQFYSQQHSTSKLTAFHIWIPCRHNVMFSQPWPLIRF